MKTCFLVDFNQLDFSNLTDSREKGIISIGIIPNNSIIGGCSGANVFDTSSIGMYKQKRTKMSNI